MDLDLPGYAWDLLPYKEKPLDLYRSPMWHGEYDHKKRTPYAALYTSLGCVFQCSFCMINILNRDDLEETGVASNYNKMRFWSPDFIIKEFDKLNELGLDASYEKELVGGASYDANGEPLTSEVLEKAKIMALNHEEKY